MNDQSIVVLLATALLLGAIGAYHFIKRIQKPVAPPSLQERLHAQIASIDETIFQRKLDDIEIGHRREGLVATLQFVQDAGAGDSLPPEFVEAFSEESMKHSGLLGDAR